jgi:hypothetical protein
MFPTQSKVNRSGSLWLLPVIALAMLLVGYAVFAASTAQAQTPSGEVCVEGIVIDWEEHPLAGWGITLTTDISTFTAITTTSAADPDDLDDEYGYGNQGNNYGDQSNGSYKKKNFPFPEEDVLQEGEFEFTEDDIAAGSDNGAVFFTTYTATIESRPGWEGVTPTSISFPIEVGNDDCIHIRFKMRRIVVVNVFKIDADHQPLGDWIIRAIPGPGNLFASPQVTETSVPVTGTGAITGATAITGGQAVFTLTPGLWIFSEQEPKRDYDEYDEGTEHYVPIVPPTGRQELLIPDDLAPTETITVVFKNELVTGCFIVRKFGEIPADGAPTTALGDEFNVAGWGFKLLRKDDSVAQQGVTDARGEIRFDNLPLGPYTIVEEDRPGWFELTAREVEFNVQGNNCDGDPTDTVVEFRNTQDDSGFCIEGRKVDANGGYGIPGWEITIEALDEGGALPVEAIDAFTLVDVDSTTTDGLGEFRFDFLRNDYRVPWWSV